MKGAGRIVFYDGECGFCTRTVRWLLVIDHYRRLKFAPLQGTAAALVLPSEFIHDVSSVVYHRDGKNFVRSEAIIRLLADCSWYWMPVYAVLLVPTSWRDGMYNWIARNRDRVFQNSVNCKLPDPDERLRFLD